MKFLKTLELAGFSIMLLLSLLSVFVDFAGQSVITGALLGLGSMAYFLAGFFFFSKSPFASYKLSIGFGAFMGFATSIVMVGLMFRAGLYEGTEMMLLIGSTLVGMCILLGLILMLRSPEHKAYWRQTLIRLGVLLVVGVFMYTQNREVVMQRKYGDYPFYIEAYEEFSQNPSEETVDKLEQARQRMDSLRSH